MATTLFGGEMSGTPIETRGATSAIGADLLRGGGRLAAASRGSLGFTPRGVGTGAAAGRLLRDPRDRLRGLFAALEPFEARETERQVAGLRSGLGRVGARFGRSALEAEGNLRGELGERFSRARQEGILQAEGMQAQTLGMILNALLQGRGQTLGFLQPGAPNFREGILGELIEAGGNVLAAQAAAGSSVAFKEDIRQVDEDSLEMIEGLNFFRFRYKGDDRERFGIILEDISVPEEFKRGDFADMNEINFHLLNAVKNLSQRVKALEAANG